MKTRFTFYFLLTAFCVSSFIATAQVNIWDSLALVDLYKSTNGPNWRYSNNWLTAAPVPEWSGVYVSGNRVEEIMLSNDKLNGALPASLGNLTKLSYLDLSQNQLSGSIPAELGNLANLV